MPLDTMASAVSRMSCSLTLQPNLFQLFQPIWGVLARPSNFCANAAGDTSNNATNPMRAFIRPPGVPNDPSSRYSALPAEGRAQCAHDRIAGIAFALDHFHRRLRNSHAELAIGLELLFIEELVGR